MPAHAQARNELQERNCLRDRMATRSPGLIPRAIIAPARCAARLVTSPQLSRKLPCAAAALAVCKVAARSSIIWVGGNIRRFLTSGYRHGQVAGHRYAFSSWA